MLFGVTFICILDVYARSLLFLVNLKRVAQKEKMMILGFEESPKFKVLNLKERKHKHNKLKKIGFLFINF